MNKIILGLVVFVISKLNYASHIVDVYGTDKIHSEKILQAYRKSIIEIQTESLKQMNSFYVTGKEDRINATRLEERKKKLIQEIKQKEGLLYVAFHTTTYVNNNNLYTTVEVIDKTSPERLKFVEVSEEISKDIKQNDLVAKMEEYVEQGWKLEALKELDDLNPSCPVYHCIFGFNHPKLKPYLNIFNLGVNKEKINILDTLKNDVNPRRRAAAALLVGHLENPEEIISSLSKHVQDKSPHVRNDVIRVISETMHKSKINHINVEPFLKLLDSPYGTDRNKALSLLFTASLNPKSRTVIINKGEKNLLKILQMKQPNNHEWAYLILKRISGKNYGEYDIPAWKKWFSKNSSRTCKIKPIL
ncbi:HEAT repeat domain-containing protein [Legionella septentrionalis]|uniref:HEAT repeat domain-containing protein n=1 Tax=Legionella septentrionalis TaxID=2498109 RepID=A0A3S0V4M3_9GAMM|nr:HEAT repeat domain-containing protein [Legionella septentrionalis]RUQ81713.1 HEAT repeat domain-containing protein [Legionella septentrionalis]RUQ93703.1 HEAT repeat domain-containing protein [Legionella septentrionalis]RUR08524.1 HEAT repeat domain-containing protein [Legionella septentrionalis]